MELNLALLVTNDMWRPLIVWTRTQVAVHYKTLSSGPNSCHAETTYLLAFNVRACHGNSSSRPSCLWGYQRLQTLNTPCPSLNKKNGRKGRGGGWKGEYSYLLWAGQFLLNCNNTMYDMTNSLNIKNKKVTITQYINEFHHLKPR